MFRQPGRAGDCRMVRTARLTDERLRGMPACLTQSTGFELAGRVDRCVQAVPDERPGNDPPPITEVAPHGMHVTARTDETFDQLLRRFKTGMEKAGILREYKRKQRFKSAGELRREKAKAAARRRAKGRGRGR